jgi:hypothetical protein
MFEKAHGPCGQLGSRLGVHTRSPFNQRDV